MLRVVRDRLREDSLLAPESLADQVPQEHEPIDDCCIARFLLAGRFDEARAEANLRLYISWRREQDGVIPPPTEFLNRASVLLPFEDKFGRPCVVIRCRFFPAQELPMETLKVGFCAILDAVQGYLLGKRGAGQASPDNRLDQYVAILDCRDASKRNFSLEGVKMMQSLATFRYAEKVSKMYILGPSLIARGLWRMVRPLLLEHTQNNINLVPADEVPRVMCELLGDRAQELLPPEYGGAAAIWSDPEDCTTLEQKAGALAADSWRQLGVAPPWDSDATLGGTAGARPSAGAQGAPTPPQQRRGGNPLALAAIFSPCFAWLSM